MSIGAWQWLTRAKATTGNPPVQCVHMSENRKGNTFLSSHVIVQATSTNVQI
jgi:hypothetical protein